MVANNFKPGMAGMFRVRGSRALEKAPCRLKLRGNCLNMWVFPTIRGALLAVPIIRTIAFWGLYWGPLVLDNYHVFYAWGMHRHQVMMFAAGPDASNRVFGTARPGR